MSNKSTSTPVRIEAEDVETITVTWEGFELEVPASVDKWDAKVLKAFEENKAIVAVDRLLGPRQSTELNNGFRKKYGRPMRVEDYGALMGEIANTYGFESTGE